MGTVAVAGPDGSWMTVPATLTAFEPADTQLASAFYQYRCDIAGLRAGTCYTYKVSVDGQNLASDPAEFRFRTAPAAQSERFSFLAFGDSGACSSEQQTLAQSMAAEKNVAMAVHVGDLAYPDGTFAEFDAAYYGMNAPLMSRIPFFATPGNHEYDTESASPYLAGIVAPESGVPAAGLGRYYSFNWANAHFVSLDSNLLGTSGAAAMLAWLDADLAAVDLYWRIVFLHHTPYPTGFHVGDATCAAVQELVNPIVERHGVQLVLAGHEHAYERSYPLAGNQPVESSERSTTYVVTGGGGGALESVGSSVQCECSVQAFHYLRVDVDGESLTVTAIGLDGGEIDQFTIGAMKPMAVHSVLSMGDYSREIAAGSLVAISGQNLCLRSAASGGQSLPTGLGDVAVTVGGRAAPLLSVSSTQIHAQVPYGISGPAVLEVSTANGLASANITVSPTAPSLLGIVLRGAPFSIANPARPAGEVSLYVTGLGEVEGGIACGQAAPSTPVRVVAAVEVWLGRMRLQPLSCGLAPGLAGVYLVKIAIPPELPDGLYAVQVVAGGIGSRPANLDVVASGTAYRNDRAISRVRRRVS